MYKTNNVKPNATTIPIKGARKMNAAIFRMILNWMASKPVSYTHLDVYKRQILPTLGITVEF